jgi:diguanylate cyclase (GGDEF)-like protein
MIDNDLFKEHQQLCHRLNMFINQARINEQKMQRFQDMELQLIGSRSLRELCDNILNNYRQEFALDVVTLGLIDENYELRRFVEEDNINNRNLIFYDTDQLLEHLFPKPLAPQLGEFDLQQHAFLLSPVSAPIKSLACLPLIRYGSLIGSLNLGSESRERFSKEFGTEFLERLATIVAMCLENTINHERLKRVGLTDALTSINNRRYFDQRLLEEIGRGLRTQEPLACLFMDIDHFKRINDSQGHQVGDTVLRAVASIIREQLRNSDVLCRYGGEEFAALLTCTGKSTAKEVAERIRGNVEKHRFDLSAHSKADPGLKVTISIGISLMDLSAPVNDINQIAAILVKQADQALYQAKKQGRNRVSVLSSKDFAKPGGRKENLVNP